MATQPPQETPVSPEPFQPTQPMPEFEPPSPDVDIPDMDPATNPPTVGGGGNGGGDIDDRGLFASASTVGYPDGEPDEIGTTDRMTSSTGGLAGTSR
jgi:hypothetical protein